MSLGVELRLFLQLVADLVVVHGAPLVDDGRLRDLSAGAGLIGDSLVVFVTILLDQLEVDYHRYLDV